MKTESVDISETTTERTRKHAAEKIKNSK
jgi:hypothetical protein